MCVMGLMANVGCGPSVPIVDPSGDSTGEPDATSSGGVTTLTMPSTGDETSTTVSLDDGSSSSGMFTTMTPPEETSTGPDVDETTSTGPDIDETTSTGPDVDPTTGFTTVDTDPTDTDPDPTDSPQLPNGAQCSADDECQSMQCFEAGPLGGICGECDEDADCPGGGCTIPNPLTSEPSECNDGSFGSGCETSAVCMPGLVCKTIVEVEGVIVSNTCGDCLDDMDCMAGETCQPNPDVVNFGAGQWECVLESSLPNGHGCDPDNGANACISGNCDEASFMMLLVLGICGECVDDMDCGPGETCTPGEIDLAQGLVGSICE